MTEITLFRFENKPLEVFVQGNGDVVFDAAEVCRILELSHVGSALRILDEDEKGVHTKHTLGGDQKATFITEPGLYKLISRSRKPEAKRFDRWVRHDVLPEIRKTGGYKAAPAIDLNDPAFLRQTLLGYTEKVIALEAENAALTPKAESFDALANLEGRHNLRSAAAQCGWPQNKFIDQLITLGWVYVNPVTGRKHAYSDRLKTGMMEVKNVEVKRTGYTEGVGQPMITQKGLARLKMLLGVYQAAPSREMELH
ncbi:phage antirepressor KilAC domain-containing protein [Gluconobacter oxydans]|uniref:phage antirepressor KilAC domain-containing protein n=1 Tax=Gluconobacter oxydans TaxID=442 RepID=UPI00062C8929|nr:phage antirepressor KilAC domain-containing protein [Gluconobacter oxydans]